MSSPFRAIPAAIDLPAMERSILDFWRENDIFHKSTESRAGATPWTFYEGPPTANGMPGTHHIEARVFKDVFPRYQTMKGKYVTRKAGWDCHGLPVEIAVEKEPSHVKPVGIVTDFLLKLRWRKNLDSQARAILKSMASHPLTISAANL